MAGFDKIKRTLEVLNTATNEYETRLDDVIDVPYQKFYEDDEILGFNYEQFDIASQFLGLKTGEYRFTVDTLGRYIDTTCIYVINMQPTTNMVQSCLS